MTNFEFYLYKSKKRLNSKPRETEFVKKFLSRLYPYVQNLKKSNPNFSYDNLKNIFEKDYEEICDAVFASGHIYSKCIEYQCCTYLQNNPKEFNKILELIKDPEIEIPENYGNNFNSNLLLYTKFLKKEYDKFMKTFLKTPIFAEAKIFLTDPNKSPNEKKKFYNSVLNNLSAIHKKDFKDFYSCICQEEFAFLKIDSENITGELKEDSIESISSIGSWLDKFGFLEKYPAIQSISNRKLLNNENSSDIEKYNYTIDSTSSENIGVRSMLSKSFLNQKSLETLLALNTFWVNRFVKELDTYSEGLYICDQLDLLPQMLNDTFKLDDLKDEDIKNIITKMNILYLPSYDFWEFASTHKNDVINIEVPGKPYYFIDNNAFLNNVESDIGEEYSNYFNNLKAPLPNNDLKKDLNLFWKLYNPVINGYKTKDSNILASFMLPQITKNFSHNWGIVLEGNPKETLANPEAPINFWMDIEGLNLPVRYHQKKSTLIQSLKDSSSDKYVPLYKNPEAFDSISTNLLLPLNKRQISFLKTCKKQNFDGFDDKAKNFLEHSLTLINPKNFDKSKFNTETQYLNLDNLNIYKKDKNGEYILVLETEKQELEK